MPYFLIERNFAEQLEATRQDVDRINQINEESGVDWLISFLSADRKKTFCLYQAPSVEAIRDAARRAGIPADEIIEVTELRRDGDTGPVQPERFALAQPRE